MNSSPCVPSDNNTLQHLIASSGAILSTSCPRNFGRPMAGAHLSIPHGTAGERRTACRKRRSTQRHRGGPGARIGSPRLALSPAFSLPPVCGSHRALSRPTGPSTAAHHLRGSNRPERLSHFICGGFHLPTASYVLWNPSLGNSR